MSSIPTNTEQELSNLNPAGLEEDFLARLTACADGTHANLSDDEVAFEIRLLTLRPRAIPSALQNSLLFKLGDTPFAVDEKIVLFSMPSRGTGATGNKKSAYRFNVAAAAAVALLGSFAALMVPAETGKELSAQAGDGRESPSAPIIPVPSLVAPAGFNRNISETRDEGVIWRGKNQPHRVLRLTYTDQVTAKDAAGNPVVKAQPRVEYVIIPEKID